MTYKLTTISTDVNYSLSNRSTKQKLVNFEVYLNDGIYTIVPLLNEEQKKLVNLPDEISFIHVDGKAVSLRGRKDDHHYIIKAIAEQLPGLES